MEITMNPILFGIGFTIFFTIFMFTLGGLGMIFYDNWKSLRRWWKRRHCNHGLYIVHQDRSSCNTCDN